MRCDRKSIPKNSIQPSAISPAAAGLEVKGPCHSERSEESSPLRHLLPMFSLHSTAFKSEPHANINDAPKSKPQKGTKGRSGFCVF